MLLAAWLVLDGTEGTVAAERLRTAKVERGRFVSDVNAQGVIVAAVSPTLYAPASGSVAFRVKAGETVSRDQLLAVVTSPELESELDRERATLAQLDATLSREAIEVRRRALASQQEIDAARVTLKAAEREAQRAEWGWDLKAIPKREYDQSRDELESARIAFAHAEKTAALETESLEFDLSMRRADRDRQRVVVRELERQVAALRIVSPVDGVVGSLAVDERAAVARDAALLTVVDLSAYEVEFTVPDTYASSLAAGMPAEVSVAGRKLRATVGAVSPEVQRNEVTGRLKFDGDMPPGLRQNQRVSARVLLDERDSALKVQRGAFLDSGGGRVAYVIRDGEAVRTPIRIGATSIGEVELLDGVAVGDEIVVSSLDVFEGKERVRIAGFQE